MSVDETHLNGPVDLETDGVMVVLSDADGNAIVAPFEEGSIYIAGENMTVLYGFYAPDTPGWTFLLDSNPLAITAVAGKADCGCADCGCEEASS